MRQEPTLGPVQGEGIVERQPLFGPWVLLAISGLW